MSSETTTVVPWKNLGKSGLKISNIIIGCMGFGSKKWDPWVIEDKQEVFKILKKAYDHGIRTYDTADNYSNGLSEKILGEFLKEYKIQRDKVVVMTKFWGPTDDAYPEGASRKHIIDAAKNSSERLGTYIDVFQLHRFDKETPIEETMKALNDVVDAGYTRYIGASTMRAVEFVEMQHVAEKNGWHKFISMQSLYNLLQREDEAEMNYYCDKTGVGLIPWSPLMGGVLARPVPKDESEKTERIKTSMFTVFFKSADLTIGTKGQDSDIEIVNRVGEIAKTKGTSMAAVATAWVIAKGAAPIIGFTTVERVDDAVEGANLKLTEEEIKYLEEPYLPRARVA
ncbi:unnamed protein product [Wickerhamomyces anomalus]